jgi:RNA recognition motif-containing protein
MNIHVGNLPPELTEEELKKEFSAFGEVASVSIIRDKSSGLPRGFAFVEMPSLMEGGTAVKDLAGKVLKDKVIEVSEARPRSATSSFRHREGGSYGGRSGRFGGAGKETR